MFVNVVNAISLYAIPVIILVICTYDVVKKAASVIRGTNSSDVLKGTAAGEILFGLAGNDTLDPGGGREQKLSIIKHGLGFKAFGF